MKIARRVFLGAASAAVLVRPGRAADKIAGGSLGGQAPLWPFYIALHKGFLAAQGIDLDLTLAQSGAAVTQELTAGSLDVVLSVGISDPIHAIDKGAALAIVRIIGDAPPYVLIGKPGLKSIADLKGKTVSVGTKGDPTTLYFERMAVANGLKPGDYEVVSAGVAAARFAALKAGVADAAMVLPPLNFRATKAGYVTLGVAADYVKDLPFTAMAVYRPWTAAHVPLVKRLLAATDQSIAWLNDAAHRQDAVDLLVQVAHANAEDAAESYDLLGRIRYFQPDSKVSRKRLQNVIDVERRDGYVGSSLSVEQVILQGVTETAD